MKTNFNFSTFDWEGSAAARVSRHDLVFNAPPFDPIKYGMPIGNGDIGALIWCENERLYIAVNKCDLWDDLKTGDFSNWKLEEEEKSSVLRHGFRIIIDFGDPVFDEFYLGEFQARISLAEGTAKIHSVTPFASLDLSVFITGDEKLGKSVLCCKLDIEQKEKHDISIICERYGSRSFSHWYHRAINDPEIGLGGSEAYSSPGNLTITQKISSGTFASGIKFAPAGSCKVIDSHRVSGIISQYCEIYASVTSPSENGCVDELADILGSAEKQGYDLLSQKNILSWNSFWCRSYIRTDNDFWDMLYTLNLYYMRSCQGGKYPGRFIDGLWAPMRDYQAWAFYFHWNQQMLCWPLNAAGQHELCDSYLNYRFNTLDKAIESARKYQNVENGGAYVSDVCDRNGNNSLSELKNHTPVAEVALDFYRQYKYSCSEEFLSQKALPYMIAASKYFMTLFRKEKDGKYHAVNGTAYEGWTQLYDVTTELVYAKALFTATLEALETAGKDIPESAVWSDILNNLAPVLMRQPGDQYTGGGKITTGVFKGDDYDGGNVFAAGYSIENNETVIDGGVFPTATRSPVFPSGTVGIKDKGSVLYDDAVRTTRIFAEIGNGWDPVIITAARLGLGDEVGRIFDAHVDHWLISSNGFGHYTDSTDYSDRYAYNEIDVYDKGYNFIGRRRSSEWGLRHIGLECTSVLSCGLSESLLQSHEGVIRVFPAAAKKKSACFTLHARDGFKVSAEIAEGNVLWIAIESLCGRTLSLVNPWEICWCGEKLYSDRIISFNTKKGERFIFAGEQCPELECEAIKDEPNNDVKRHKSGRTIGRESTF